MKKAMLAAGVIIIAVFVAVFLYRYAILQYSADALIRKLLPKYVEIENISFQPQIGKLILKKFRILNPSGFSVKYLLEVDEVVCAYRMRGKNILDGVEVLEPVLKRPTLTIERLRDGTLNIIRMPQFIQGMSLQRPAVREDNRISPGWRSESMQKGINKGIQAMVGNKSVSDIFKLPEVFIVKDGQLVFVDRMPQTAGTIILSSIEAQIDVKLNKAYTAITSAGSTGEGVVNNRKSEVVRWNSIWNPVTPRLTMANRFNVSGIDMVTFKPYYDRFSPFDFKRGTFSGTLVFDFDNGNIGSTNEVRLSNIAFAVKQDAPNAGFWDTSASDLARYFMTPQGEIVFDFKIKGDMNSPRFYLGPISKQAVTAMAIDKVTQAIQQAARGAAKSEGAGESGGKETDIQKAAKYIDLISEMMSKKK